MPRLKERRPVVVHPEKPDLALVHLDKGEPALIDARFASSVARYTWTLHVSPRPNNYVCTTLGRRMLPLHRFVWSLDGRPEVPMLDHKNRNRLDCRLDNLRPATYSQNSANAKLLSSNRSGYRGVSWSAKDRKWRAIIGVGGRKRFLGNFADLESAARVYDAWSAEAFGEYAFLNFPGDKHG